MFKELSVDVEIIFFEKRRKQLQGCWVSYMQNFETNLVNIYECLISENIGQVIRFRKCHHPEGKEMSIPSMTLDKTRFIILSMYLICSFFTSSCKFC